MSESKLPEDIFATFCSGIDQAAAQKIANGINIATQQGAKRVHLLFQSSGGSIGDGIFLYNFFRSCPIGVSLYNAGTVASIAVVAFLGAEKRIVSKHATFMVHPSMNAPQPVNTADRLKAVVESLKIDDARTAAILKESLEVSEEKWNILRHNELWFTATEAVVSKLATAIGDFAPPAGSQVYNF